MHLWRFLPLSVALLAALSAQAATSPVQSTGKATAAVTNNCTIQTLDSISLGAYSPISGLAATGTGELRLLCTKGTAVSAAPSSGGSSLKGANGSLTYALYSDAAMSSYWGSGDTRLYTATGTTFTQFSTVLTEAQFLANPDYAKGFYVRQSGNQTPRSGGGGTSVVKYYVGYLGQSTNTIAGSAVSVTSVATYTSNGGNDLRNLFGSVSTNNWAQQVNTVSADKLSVTSSGNGNNNVYNYSVSTQYVIPPNSSISGVSYTVPTGNGTALKGTATSALSVLSLVYYAKAPAGQDVVPGAYSDTVIVQVSF